MSESIFESFEAYLKEADYPKRKEKNHAGGGRFDFY